MNRHRVEGNLKQLRGWVRERWGSLTGDDVQIAVGKIDRMMGTLQERYGVRRDEVLREIDAFQRSLTLKISEPPETSI